MERVENNKDVLRTFENLLVSLEPSVVAQLLILSCSYSLP